MPPVQALFDRLWKQYAETNPLAQQIHDLFSNHGEDVVNDHVAFRTFALEKVNIDKVARCFIELGYENRASYDFDEKKLNARHFEHPSGEHPLVFISELRVNEFSDFLRQTVSRLVDAVPQDVIDDAGFITSGVSWPMISRVSYEKLRKESEYAAWIATFGYRANHFTVSVKDLQGFNGLASLNSYLKENGFQLNSFGGEIKGSPNLYLEQSSTMADHVEVQFSDCLQAIPCCFYEFAHRYTLPDGTLFKGFVAQSANRLFESTNKIN